MPESPSKSSGSGAVFLEMMQISAKQKISRSFCRRRHILTIALALLTLVAWLPAQAKDIRLGGTNAQPGAPAPKPAPNIVELPTIVMALPKDDGGWHHVQIDAWLAPGDVSTARDMEDMKSSIVKNAKETLPGPLGFDALRSARDGNRVAKEAIHTAAEKSLGHTWSGEVFIRNMLVY